MAQGGSQYIISAGVPLPQKPGVVKVPSIPSEETLTPAQVMEGIPIATVENRIDTKMDNLMKAFGGWTSQLSEATMPRYGSYDTARAYAIQADHAPPHTPIAMGVLCPTQQHFSQSINTSVCNGSGQPARGLVLGRWFGLVRFMTRPETLPAVS